MGRGLIAALVAIAALPCAALPRLDLSGYIDEAGAVSVQRGGDTIDPYFALQAFLLAHDNGLDARADARRWAAWLLPRQKPDATFDRFCRRGPVWAPCKTADADDALLALWMRFLRTTSPGGALPGPWRASHDAAAATLARLFDPARGVYNVSPVYQHALFIDNLEVWSASVPPARARLAAAIRDVFWDGAEARFLVSTQPSQKSVPRAFYPDAVAQIFPLLLGFPHVDARAGYYARWMRKHRAEWLRQGAADFAWGLIAVAALRQGDAASAACWLREALPLRHGPHWTVTDEVSRQVLAARGIEAAPAGTSCD